MELKIPFIKAFKPGNPGIHQVLGELEGDVMKILWKANHGLTGRDVLGKFTGKKKIAYTTILTVLDRLVNKGLVRKQKSIANTYLYEPTISEEEFKKEVSRAVLKGVLELSGSGAVTTFVNLLEGIDPSAIQKLEEILQNKKGRLVEGQK